ncbi:uncharacterized protein GBIM_04093 [Gryllus bimaculatus]|nr:uncharacterized protein GBIM_04093 [Gryllus bimaculatus]
MLIGQVTRYIAGRSAVQTVYWRTGKNGSQKLVKTGRILNFGSPKPQQAEAASRDSLDALMKLLHEQDSTPTPKYTI